MRGKFTLTRAIPKPSVESPARQETEINAAPQLHDGDALNDRLAVRSFEAGQLTTLGQSTIEAMARRGEVPCVRVGTGRKHRAVIFPVSALRQWLHEQAMENLGNPADGDDEEHEPDHDARDGGAG